MTTVQIEAGTLTASSADRIVSGLLLPYGEIGNTNLGRFAVDRGKVTIPADVTVLAANTDHKRENPVARFLTATETDAGVVSSFYIGKNAEGDELLAEIESTDNPAARKSLSVEIADVVLRAGRLVSGKLFGAAFVPKGAFPSAALMAADVGDEVDDTEPQNPAPAESEPVAPAATPPKEDAVTTATVPETLQATAPAEKKPLNKSQVFDILHAIHLGQADDTMLAALKENSGPAAGTLFAALNDVKYDSTGGLTNGIQTPQWIGQVWDGIEYAQRYLPLFGHKDLTGLSFSGYKWGTKPHGGTWAGNKANVNSNAPTMVPVTGTALRYSMGHDLAREFRDLQAFGDRSFFDSYYAAGADDYAQWADETVVLTAVKAGATTVEADNPTGLDIGAGLSAVIDGAAAVITAKANPSFALVEASLWKSIVKIGKNDVLGYLNAALNLKEGQLDGFRMLPTDQLSAGNVLVGAKEAVTVYELPGVPIRVEAPDMVKGGIDTGLFGYAGVVINKATALQLVTPYTA